jgi:hypothetical protein
MYFVELGVKGLVYGCMYAMMAVGLTLVYGLLRILHIAHAGVFALGAFLAVVVANATGSLALGFALAIVVSAVAGVAIYRFAYQPLLGHAAFVPMIVSIGIFIVMQEGFRMVFGAYGIAFDHNPGELQGARHHRAGRAGQRARHPDREPDPGRGRVLRHDLSRRHLRPRCHRLSVPDRRADGAAAGSAGTRMK